MTPQDPTDIAYAVDLLEQCARRLMQMGGMLNKDLAAEITRFTSRAKLASNVAPTEKVA